MPPAQPLRPTDLPNPFPERLFKTWWWVCACPRFHAVEVSQQVQSAVAHGAAGVFSCMDGVEDSVQCLCRHTFLFGPTIRKKQQALREAGIEREVHYSFVPVWSYAGEPAELAGFQREIRFRRGMSQVPSRRVLVSNFCEEPQLMLAITMGWRWNKVWQAQASLARHRMSQAAVANGDVQVGQALGTVIFAPLLDPTGDNRRDAEIHGFGFWEDSSLWYLDGIPPPNRRPPLDSDSDS